MEKLESILKSYQDKGFDLELVREIKSGKEATVYAVENNGKILALKVYVNPEHRAFDATKTYLEGRYFRKPSARKAVAKKAAFGKKFIHESWIRREFYLLQKLHELGVHIPRSYEWTNDSVLMDFIGDIDPAPRLVDVDLSIPQAQAAFESVINDIIVSLGAGIIHGDLSPYNILWWKDTPYIIDVPQAIDIRNNPNKDEILQRDLDNLMNYFGEYFEIDREEVYRRFGLSTNLY